MTARPTIDYQPALDGLRAVAVVAVLLFHGGVPGFGGGYLGVSVFFTLSGFLITSLLVNEHDRTGRIELRRFYTRRVRRLLPASLLCLAAVVLVGAFSRVFDGVVGLRAQVFGAIFQVTNWVQLAGDGSYQDLLARSSGTSSPLEHFWSLAIEEQFYWAWPPVMLVVLSRCRERRARTVIVGAMTVIAMVAAPVIAITWGPDAAYWATPARVGEILVGAFLALVVLGRTLPTGVARLAPVAAVVLSISVVTFPSSGGPAYGGALPLVAVVSAGLILGLQADGPVRRALSHRPVVAIGRVSYGLYLYHWPIFVLVDSSRVDWSAPTIFAVRLALTVVVTVVSYRFVEQPIRMAPHRPPGRTLAGAVGATTALVAAGALIVPTGLGEYWVTDAATAEAAAIDVSETPLEALAARSSPFGRAGASPTNAAPTTTTTTATALVPRSQPADVAGATRVPVETPPSTGAVTSTTVAQPAVEPSVAPTTAPESTVPPLPDLSRPVRIVVIGDSTANAFGTGLIRWAGERPELAQVEVVAAPGCGILSGDEWRSSDAFVRIEGCHGWLDQFVYPAVERLQPDVVMVMVTSWDVIDRRWGDGPGLTPFDPGFVDRLDDEYGALRDRLIAAGAGRVAFARQPIPNVYWLPKVDAQEDPDRHGVIYRLYDRLAAADERVEVVDLAAWFTTNGLDADDVVRPDGVHLTPEAATEISDRYLGDQLVRIALGLDRP